jgi:hypothetical protein
LAGFRFAKTPEQVEELKHDIKEEYKRMYPPEVLDPKNFEVLIITAVKP